MTLLVGFPAGHEDRSGVELAATLARSSGQGLALVTVVPSAWPTPVAGHTDREFEEWSQARGRDAVADHDRRAGHAPGPHAARNQRIRVGRFRPCADRGRAHAGRSD